MAANIKAGIERGAKVLDLLRLARSKRGADTANHAVAPESVGISDFYAYMPMHRYIYKPNGELWPAQSVNARVPAQKLVDKKKPVSASAWLDRFDPVEQMTWSPSDPALILDRLIDQGGWIPRPGARVYNLYRAPLPLPGDPAKAGLWRMHLRRIYPNDYEHLERWLAHRVQRPGDKINHSIVLHGAQGIGKDTLLEPVKRAVGPWNWGEISAGQLMGQFNGWARAVVVRVSEARDLGDFDRFAFYDHSKVFMAAPPDVLRVNTKFVREYYVMNILGVIITTNHDTDGIYLPPDDRRHFVAGSEATKEEFDTAYWHDLWEWYEAGGIGHVAAYLRTLDLSEFDAKAPPPKTTAFWRIVHSNSAPEDAGLADALEHINRPRVVTLNEISEAATACSQHDVARFVADMKTRRIVQHRMRSAGYVAIPNQDAQDGLWRINGRRQVLYALRDVKYKEAVEFVRKGRAGT